MEIGKVTKQRRKQGRLLMRGSSLDGFTDLVGIAALVAGRVQCRNGEVIGPRRKIDAKGWHQANRDAAGVVLGGRSIVDLISRGARGGDIPGQFGDSRNRCPSCRGSA